MTVLQVRGKMHDGKSARDRMIEAEAILRDKADGMGDADLCEKYGVSRATLHRRIKVLLDARMTATAEQWRERENVTLDGTMERWVRQRDGAAAMVSAGTLAEDWGIVERGMRLHADALNGITRTSERRAKLNGLDAPVRAEVTVTTTTPIDSAVAALAAEIEASA